METLEKINCLVQEDHPIDKDKLSHYFTNIHSIEGWFSRLDFQLFSFIDYVQKKENMTGNLFEIGVYEGKSTILLAIMTEIEKETLGLCDIFNKFPDRKKRFLQNIKSYYSDIDFIKLYEKPSDKLTLEECKGSRFFHIDGCHFFKQTFEDLIIAGKSIIHEGVIVVDDVYNHRCPGVTEAVYEFLRTSENFLPVYLTAKKIMLCKKDMHKWYFDKINSSDVKEYVPESYFELRQNKFLGSDVISFVAKGSSNSFWKML